MERYLFCPPQYYLTRYTNILKPSLEAARGLAGDGDDGGVGVDAGVVSAITLETTAISNV